MHLTFGMGLFWLLIAWAAGDTIVKVAQALSRRGRKDASSPELERRVKELEQRLADHVELYEAREAQLIRLEEKVEFTDRLLSGRNAPGRSGGS
ncbi:MAG: hypothetical protein ABIY52_13680 [Gemmatimonadaceae bacterium]